MWTRIRYRYLTSTVSRTRLCANPIRSMPRCGSSAFGILTFTQSAALLSARCAASRRRSAKRLRCRVQRRAQYVEGPNLIQSDGELHRKLRSELLRPLTPAQLKEVRPLLREMVDAKIAGLVGADTFDGMAEIARFLPLNAVAHLVGLLSDGRDHMLEWALRSTRSARRTRGVRRISNVWTKRGPICAGLRSSSCARTAGGGRAADRSNRRRERLRPAQS
ncbi:cytochrome P450 [Bradyrhizobium elkanii]|uniref:Cytochrome P450 n=1 Tax=Bradyrhizobium elkanii TaxID=29448 RepID=A0ABV4F5J1_BRAEL|nr:cytochrome P450 [Bradyrhizobium elkanii]MCW2192847.1 cytochrome P450 [Bradyrhizobium elkanii]MCW2211828.1 cytochrome P450 [Bradyrhizobium elkanii]